MRNNKGFTITELLVIVAIMLSILGIAIYGYSKISKELKIKAREEIYSQVESSAEDYFTTNEYLKNDISPTKTAYVSVGALVSSDYMNIVTDPVTGKQLDNCTIVKVSKTDSQLEYKVVRNETEKELVQSIIGTNNSSCKYEPFIIDSNMPKLTLNIYKRDDKGDITGKALYSKIFLGQSLNDSMNIWENLPWFNLNNAPNGLILEFLTTDKSSINYSTAYSKTTNISSASSGTLKSGGRIPITANDSNITIETKFGIESVAKTVIKLDNQRPNCFIHAYGQVKNITVLENGWYSSSGNYTNLTDNSKWFTSNVDISFKNFSDNIGVTSRTISGDFSYTTGSSTLKNDTNGMLFTGYVNDAAGNINTCRITIKRDATIPSQNLKAYSGEHSIVQSLDTLAKVDDAISSGTIKLLQTNVWTNKSIILRNKPIDNLSNLHATVCIDPRNEGANFATYRRIINSHEGSFTFNCQAVDRAGNISMSSYIANRDITPPTIVVKSSKSAILSDVSNYTSTDSYSSDTWYSGYANVVAEAYDKYLEVALTYTRTPDGTLGGSGAKTKTTTAPAGNKVIFKDYSQAEGISDYTYKACDKLQNCTSRKIVVKLDRTDPVCKLNLSGTKGNLVDDIQWYKSNVGLTLSCTDNMKSINSKGLIAGGYSYNNLSTATQSAETKKVTWGGIAKDNAGNYTQVSSIFAVDKTKPTIPTSVLKEIKSDNSTFVRTNADTWTGNAIWWGNFKAKDITLDGSATGSGISYYQYSTSCTGTANNNLKTEYNFNYTKNGYYCIRSIDKAGWASAWSDPVYIRIDKTDPTCKSSGGNADWTTGDRTLTGTCRDDHSGCAKASITKKYDYNINSETETPGIVYDNVGNMTPCNANQIVRIDKTTPTISIALKKASAGTLLASGAWSNQNVNYTATSSTNHASGISTKCTLSGATSASNTGTSSVSGSSSNNGTTNISCTATTGAGNKVTTTAVINIDTKKPKCKIALSGTAGNYNGVQWYKSNVGLTLTCTDEGSDIVSKGLASGTYSYNDVTTGNQANEIKSVTWYGIAKDKAGNEGTITSTFGIDKTPPSCSISKSGTAGNYANDIQWYKSNVTLGLNCTDSFSGLGSYGLAASQYTYNNLATGTQSTETSGVTWGGIATDKAGNEAKVSYKFAIDKTPPSCSISKSGTAGKYNGVQWYKSNVGLTLSYSDERSGIASKGLAAGSYSYNNLASGTQSTETSNVTWYGIAKDAAGNECTATSNFGVDKTAPTSTLNGYVASNDTIKAFSKISDVTTAINNKTVSAFATNIWSNKAYVLYSTKSDSLSGVDEHTCDDPRENQADFEGWRRLMNSWEGQYEFTCTTKDFAGNASKISYIVKRDITKPTCSLTSSGSAKTVTFDSANYKYVATSAAKTNYTGWYTSNVKVDLTKNDTGGSGILNWDMTSSTTNTGAGKETHTRTADTASTTYYGHVKDNAGNTGICNITFKKDSTPPTINKYAGGKVSCASSGSTASNSWGYSVQFSDNLSGATLRISRYYTCGTPEGEEYGYYWFDSSKTASSTTNAVRNYTQFARCSDNTNPRMRFVLKDGAGNIYVSGNANGKNELQITADKTKKNTSTATCDGSNTYYTYE